MTRRAAFAWRSVVGAFEVENARRRPRRGAAVPPPSHGWHWRLTLDCGHRVERPCRQRRAGDEWVNVPAPRRVRCHACEAAPGARTGGAVCGGLPGADGRGAGGSSTGG